MAVLVFWVMATAITEKMECHRPRLVLLQVVAWAVVLVSLQELERHWREMVEHREVATLAAKMCGKVLAVAAVQVAQVDLLQMVQALVAPAAAEAMACCRAGLSVGVAACLPAVVQEHQQVSMHLHLFLKVDQVAAEMEQTSPLLPPLEQTIVVQAVVVAEASQHRVMAQMVAVELCMCATTMRTPQNHLVRVQTYLLHWEAQQILVLEQMLSPTTPWVRRFECE
jgi:hypothetical protein